LPLAHRPAGRYNRTLTCDGILAMRLLVAILTLGCLSGCNGTPTQSEHALIGNNEEARHQLAIQDVEAILQGMAQARERAQQLARTAR